MFHCKTSNSQGCVPTRDNKPINWAIFWKQGINQGDSLLFFICFGITCILISWSAYVIMPVGEKKWWVHVDKKNEALSSANTGGFFLFFMADKKLTSSRCRVSVGQHCKYNISLVILEVQTVLRSISKLLFWLLLSYWSSRNPLFLSNKKSWWRELNPYSLPLECRKIKAFQTFSLSNFE